MNKKAKFYIKKSRAAVNVAKFKNLIIAALLVSILNPFSTFSQNASGETSPVIFTEIGAFEPADTEWVEIYNRSAEAVNLSGWKFFEENTNHGLTVFRGIFVLAPGEFAIIANKADLLAAKYPLYTGTIFDSSWGSLKEEGEEIGLRDTAGAYLENFIYPQIMAGKSLERISYDSAVTEAANWAPPAGTNTIGSGREPSAPPETAAPTMPTGTTTESAVGTTSETSSEIPAETAETAIATSDTAEEVPAETSTGLTTENSGTTTEEPNQPFPTEGPPLTQEPAPTPAPQIVVPPFIPVNLPPIAVIEIQSGSLTAEGQTTINFDGRASSDPNGDALIFYWNMGDGTFSKSPNPTSHKFANPGTYIVQLKVTDSAGNFSSAQKTVEVIPSNSKNKNGTSSQNTSAKPESQPKEPLTLYEIRGYIYLQPISGIATEMASSSEITSLSIGQQDGNQVILTTAANNVKITPLKIQPAGATKKKTTKSKTSKKSATKKSFANGSLSKDIKITEIFPWPSSKSSADEWIEITNIGDKNVNLGNWMLADRSKLDSPYLISDTVSLMSGQSAVFNKKLTKINLNNDADSVFLADYEGNLVDQIEFKGSSADKSFALITIENTGEKSWEWVRNPTPGAANPTFEKLEGKVAKLFTGGDFQANSFMEIKGGDSAVRKINFDDEIIDPLAAQTVLSEGTDVSLNAEKKVDGTYDLKKIEDVRSAPKEEEKGGFLYWLAIGTIILSFVLNAPAIFKFLKTLKKETIDSDKPV